ncbi:MAG: hypothetical protein HRU16_04220 [Planctomycetes bacterium]|nr:hypothetical protein [Planctomycetota bacterium]
MALIQIEKDCIDDVHDFLMAKLKRGVNLTSEEKSDLAAIKHGDEAERQAVVTSWINNSGIARMAGEIASIEAAIADLNLRKTVLEGRKTDIEAYVA